MTETAGLDHGECSLRLLSLGGLVIRFWELHACLILLKREINPLQKCLEVLEDAGVVNITREHPFPVQPAMTGGNPKLVLAFEEQIAQVAAVLVGEDDSWPENIWVSIVE